MPKKKPDYGHQNTDKQLSALIEKLAESYRLASYNLEIKLGRYLVQFEKEDAAQRALFDSGELSHEDYMAWRAKKIAGTKQWEQMKAQLAIDMTQQNEIAAAMIKDSLPGIYALNHNYGTYEAETGSGIDTTYTLYDKSTVARLLKENPDLLPAPSVDIPKDERWNKHLLQSEVLRGLLSGASVQEIAEGFRAVDMTEKAAIRNARTAVTGAENAGRMDSYKRAAGMGIQMSAVWMSTLDNRTRDTHVLMDGEMLSYQEIKEGARFKNGLRYPGDTTGMPSEVYNCRCTLVAQVQGSDKFNRNANRPSEIVPSISAYNSWKKAHNTPEARRQIAKGKTLGSDYDKTAKKEDAFDINNVKFSKVGKGILWHMKHDKVEYREVAKFSEQPSEREIIRRLAGGDQTGGSCMSLAMAYAGNKQGLDVLDFRGGESRSAFASMGKSFLQGLQGAVCKTENGRDSGAAEKLLKTMEEGKEYILCTGRHAAVCRTIGGKYEYLELQSPKRGNYGNGWQPFEHDWVWFAGTYEETRQHYSMSKTLNWRFKTDDATKGDKYIASYLIDIDSLSGNDEFRAILGYINTAPDAQQKGEGGTIK